MRVANRLVLVSTIVASGVLSVVGCSSGNKEDTGSNSDPGATAEALSTTDVITTNYMPLRKGNAVRKARPRSTASASDLTYRGGPLIQNGKVYTVFWGANVAADQAKLGTFFQTVGQSAYMDWLKEYSTNGMNIGRSTFAGTFVDTSSNAKTTGTVTNQQIGQELERLITTGAVAAPDNDSLYMFYFPPGLSIDLDGQATSCVQFCAYHYTYTRSNGQNVMYGVMPDLSTGGCAQGCGANPSVFDNLTEVSSHEWIEATTDPAVGINVLSWYNDSQGEIGDICVGQAATVSGFVVQKEWSNKNGACIATDPGGGGSSSSGGSSSGGSSSGGSSSGGSSSGGSSSGGSSSGGSSSGGSSSGGSSSGGSSSGGSSSGGSSSGGSSSGGSSSGGGGCTGDSEFEPNDSAWDADYLATSLCGDLDPVGDKDDSFFQLSGTQNYDIVLSPSGDATLRVYKQTARGSWGRVQNTTPTEVKHRANGGGTYLVVVSSPSKSTQSYTVTRN